MSQPISIGPTPPERRAAALNLLFGNLSPAERASQMALTLAAVRNRRVSTDGLLAATRGDNLVGAVWASPLGGRSALVWPPQLGEGETEELADDLLRAADVWMRGEEVELATAYLSTEASNEARRLTSSGYTHTADIVYLVCESSDFPAQPPATRLTFATVDESDWARLIAVVDATYIETRDCPSLNGVRSTRDVLEGYRSSSAYSPQHWLIAQLDGADVGCLLLANHARDNHMELVYMGVTPAARGRGFGAALTQHAKWLTKCAGRANLVLAVDAQNEPALRGYAACGFREWERRCVFLKLLGV